MKKSILFLVLAAVAATACQSWPDDSKSIIHSSGQVMRVLTVDNEADSTFLRQPCVNIPVRELKGETYAMLAGKMVATVTDPSQDGVGLAGPQVGVRCRVVAVQRFDKEGEPFEVYPNVRITATRGEKALGPEGCLSVPSAYGEVERWQDIDITYTSVNTLRDTIEHITGFTAVIFQHECDHLDGIIYTDYLK